MKALNRAFFEERDTLTIAKELLGKYLVREYDGRIIVGQITEVEAYIGAIDKACHAYGGKKTKRTQTLYEKGGTCYVYLIYGMYCCMNVVTEKEGSAAAVLLRGVELLEGADLAAQLRYGKPLDELTSAQRKNFTNGPGKLCRAMAVTKDDNGLDFCGGELFITDTWNGALTEPFSIEAGPRVGINYAEEAIDFPWRFCLKR